MLISLIIENSEESKQIDCYEKIDVLIAMHKIESKIIEEIPELRSLTVTEYRIPHSANDVLLDDNCSIV
jgi:hypothetical protein